MDPSMLSMLNSIEMQLEWFANVSHIELDKSIYFVHILLFMYDNENQCKMPTSITLCFTSYLNFKVLLVQ